MLRKKLCVEKPKVSTTSSDISSPFFPPKTTTFPEKFIKIQTDLNEALAELSFKPPVLYKYNPVEYASEANNLYINKYCNGPKKVVFVGMNPGPWGMCQTGVPFGEINTVKDWLKIETAVGRPPVECPERKITGFECKRKEVSGDRLWGVLKKICGEAEVFFAQCFVYNYCPLAFMKKGGNNVTPNEIKESKQLESICDEYYLKIIELLQPEIVVAIGAYIEKRSLQALKSKSGVKILRLAHPSPRAVNNTNWSEKAEEFFQTNDLVKYLKNE